jgi:phospholipid/cholesterol/gamma-HCH transport system substrate-binding protein
MANKLNNNLKLGSFVLAGLFFLVLLLFMIGKNKNLFGNTYVLKARFENIQGLVAGNNVRFSGLQAGTVKKVTILNDTTIEVTLLIETRMKRIIRKNAQAAISTDGLVGNKVVNISPAHQPASLAEEGDILLSKKAVNTDDILQTLSETSKDVADIATELKTTVMRFNNSNGLWALLNDETLPQNLRLSLANINLATTKAGLITNNLNDIVLNVKNGKGSVGKLLKDTSFAYNLQEAILKIKAVGEEADSLAGEINKMLAGIQHDINYGKGSVNALFKDSLMVVKLNNSLDNIQKGTDGFNQNMEALKHNFLLRGYFKKKERLKKNNISQ